MNRPAARYLAAADPVLARVIKRVGPYRLAPAKDETFPALLESIVHQQLHTKVARIIHQRVVKLFNNEPTPVALLALDEAILRGAGLSKNKFASLRDLAEKCRTGVVPPRRELEYLSDDEVIRRLVEVRGIGVWTAQMFLMFRLGRPDVMPSGDFGVRKAFGLLYRKNGRLPPASALERHARLWAPFRTAASWYLWRSLDMTVVALMLALACGAHAAEPMLDDLSPAVRLEAAKARAAHFEQATMPLLEKFFEAEPDERIRADMAVTLSTEPAQLNNPEATRLLKELFAHDPSPLVRKTVTRALVVRAALVEAQRRDRIRNAPGPRKTPRAKEPKPDAVKGVDACDGPWAWCDCGVLPRIRSHCLQRRECVRRDLENYRPIGQGCSWNGFSLRPDQSSRETGEKTLE